MGYRMMLLRLKIHDLGNGRWDFRSDYNDWPHELEFLEQPVRRLVCRIWGHRPFNPHSWKHGYCYRCRKDLR